MRAEHTLSQSLSLFTNNKFINSSVIMKTKRQGKVSLSSSSSAKKCRFSVVMFEYVFKALGFYEEAPPFHEDDLK